MTKFVYILTKEFQIPMQNIRPYKVLAPASSLLSRPTSGPASLLALLLGERQFELQTDSGPRGFDREARAASVNLQDALVPFIERGEPQASVGMN